jgi:hypothetical protein
MELLIKLGKGQQSKGGVTVEVWVVKYKDGKMVGNGRSEASSIADARLFTSKPAAEAAAAFLNKGLHENHLGRAVAERVS